MKCPDLTVGKRLFCGRGNPEGLGRGQTEILGAGYIQGPAISGDPAQFPGGTPFDQGSFNIGQNGNLNASKPPWIGSFYALVTKMTARVMGFLKVDTHLSSKAINAKIIYTEVLFAKVKNFNIEHPSKEGMRLVYSCLEGPENGVYTRGTVKNDTVIYLPKVWKDLVHKESITVQIQPIGAHQDIIVKKFNNEVIHLQSKSGIPINCFYHVYAERKDVPKLQVEMPE